MSFTLYFSERVENCRRLALEFQYFIIRSKALRKVFISIKGIYFQAELFGQTITWIVPHRFNQKTSGDVDYSVMTTFLEFHEVLMGFVNYKLFNSIGVKYPLFIDESKAGSGENLKSLTAESLADSDPIDHKKVPKAVLKATERRISTLDDLLRKVARNDAKEAEASSAPESSSAQVAAEEEGDVFDETERAEIESMEKFKNLFSGCVVWLSREVPRENIEFLVRAFGGQIAWDGSSIEEDSATITHHVVDRGTEPANKRIDRDYIQPQWLFDSVNARILLPVDLYAPTAKLPPHLSPFVDSEVDGYTPDFQAKIQEYVAAANAGNGGANAPTITMDEEDVESEETEESEGDEERFKRELAAERKGKYTEEADDDDEDEDAGSDNEEEATTNGMDVDEKEESEEYVDEQDAYMAKHSYKNRGIRKDFEEKRNKKRTKEQREEEETQAMAISMLPNKKRKLLEHLQRGKRRGEDRTMALEEKKRKLSSKELTISPEGILVKKK